MYKYWVFLLLSFSVQAARLEPGAAGIRETPLPRVYEANRGQAGPGVRYLSRQRGYTAFFLDDSVGFVFPRLKAAPVQPPLSLEAPRHAEPMAPETIRLRWLDGKPVKPAGENSLSSVSHYYVGNDTSRWLTDVPHFESLHYDGIYEGIDLIFGRRGQNIEYRFTVDPGGDPGRIRLALNIKAAMDANGNLVAGIAEGQVTMSRPRAWQGTKPVDCRFAPGAGGEWTFVLGDYDPEQPLIIDPVIEYLTYLGGNTHDAAAAIAIDTTGAASITGYLQSPQYPVLDPFQQITGSTQDVFVAKISPEGNRLIYYAYLGGSNMDAGERIEVDPSFNVYVAGWTGSPNFGTRNPAQAEFGGGYENAFIAKLNAQGKLTYATYLGGNNQERPSWMVVDEMGAVYICGFSFSGNFPVKNALQTQSLPRPDGILAKLSPEGNQFLFATYFGGSGADYVQGMALDGQKNIYLTGYTSSVDLPATAGVLQRDYRSRSGANAFVFKLNPTADRVLAGTYFGGTANAGIFSIQLNSSGSIWLLGNGLGDGLQLKNPIQARPAGDLDGILARLSGDLQELQFSTWFGGTRADLARWGLAIDRDDSVIVTGFTYSPDFPVLNSLFSFRGAEIGYKNDAFVMKFAASGNPLVYSSLIAGSGQDYADNVALDAHGAIYIGMTTGSTDLPVKNPLQAVHGGGSQDIAILKLAADRSALPPALAISPSTVPFDSTVGETDPPAQTVQLAAASGGAIAYAVTVAYASGGGWLTVTPEAGSTPAVLRLAVKTAGLAPGEYRATVNVNTTGSVQAVTVTLKVYAAAARMTALEPSVVPARSDETVVTVRGSGFMPGSLVQIGGSPLPTTYVDSSTMRVTLGKPMLTNEVTFPLVVVNPLAKPSAGLLMTIGRPLPEVVYNGVTNAASYQSNMVSPGLLVALFGARLGPEQLTGARIGDNGRLRTELAGTRIFFDGMEAPLVYVSATQVGAIVPFGVAGRRTVEVVAEQGGQRSTPRALQVLEVAPGIFTANASGAGLASALNQDGTVNTAGNGAARGTVVTIYATGLGVLSPAVEDGEIAGPDLSRPIAPVKVFVDGIESEVLYAGSAPGLVSGVAQVNFRVPEGAVIGSVVLAVGGLESQEGVFIAVRE